MCVPGLRRRPTTVLTNDSFRHEEHRTGFRSQYFSGPQFDCRDMRFFALDLCCHLKINEPGGRETAVVWYQTRRILRGGDAAAAAAAGKRTAVRKSRGVCCVVT